MPLELIVGAAVGVAAASPNIRKVLRQGMVYGLAGALIAYDRVAAMTHKVKKEAASQPQATEKTPATDAPKPAPVTTEQPRAEQAPASAQPTAAATPS
jgi:hypothetical protein